jgi:hypothetical protein
MPITSTIQQGTLSLAAVTPGNSAIGDAAAAGTSASVARADHKHGREASGTPGASAVGDTASTGSATTVALSDHRHSREAFGTPVNLDASVTSLSAGSLTTVARADHIHTLSKVPVLIASTTLASDTSSISFSSIPGTYKTLRLLWVLKTNATGGATDTGKLQFNSDTGSNYSSFGAGQVSSQTYIEFAVDAQAASTTQFACGEMYLFSYADSTGTPRKNAMILSTYNASTSTNIGWFTVTGGQWTGTAAITSIQLGIVAGTNWKTGSTVQMYGYP